MRFEILGPLRIEQGDHRAVTAGRDRVVLSMLLLHPGRVVGFDELVDAVWESGPPATARGQLQTCVSRLRRSLPAAVIITDPAGYGIEVAADDLDAAVFGRIAAEARALVTHAPDEARRLLRHGLALWRGPALAGVDSRAVRHGAAVLDEQYAVAVEDWVELELCGGRERDLISELSGLVERFPLRERLRAQLMLALYRAGRQADALAEYRRARAVLHDELGIEPGPGLRDMQQRILAGAEPAGVGPGTTRPGTTRPGADRSGADRTGADRTGADRTGADRTGAGRPGTPVRCLPRTVGDFTGRDDAVLRMLQAVEQADHGGSAIQLIDGMAGSGKTTLALHLAGMVADRYPDAQLFIDLHGHSERRPVDPAAALMTLLRQLGVDAERISTDLDERIALWRTELAARRALVVLDNAASSAQVTPLLPAGPGCLTLVTSRRRLTGLDGVRPESLQVLSEADAVDLFARIVGARVTDEPAAAIEVVRRCGRLPLAIRLAGGRLAHRPRWRVADLVRRLHEVVLPELIAEDRTVANAFALSYEQLDEPAQRVFRFLGRYPGDRFEALAVAALTDLRQQDAEDLLDDLVDVHLVEEPEPGRYRLHDLVREYAANLAARHPSDDAAAGTARLLDFQLHAFLAANPEPQQPELAATLHLGEPGRPDLLAALQDPTGHLERERPHVAALVEAGIAAGHPEYAWLLPRVAWRYLWTRGYSDDIVDLQRRALQLARAAGNDVATAMSANYLASAYSRLADYETACELLEEAVRLYREAGDREGEGVSLANLGIIYEAMGRVQDSADLARIALRMPPGPNKTRLGLRLNMLAVACGLLGDHDEALRYQRRRLMHAIAQRDTVGIGNSFLHLAILKAKTSAAAIPVSRRMLRAALHLQRGTGYFIGQAEIINEMGVLHRLEGQHQAAIAAHQEALDMVCQINDRRYESVFRNDLATVVLQTGDAAGAAAHHRRALSLATTIKHPFEQGRAHAGLADSLFDTDPTKARRHWEQALIIFTRMGVPERFAVQRRLAELDGEADQLQEAGRRGTMEP